MPITEIISKKGIFFDYKQKYEGASDEITPANVDEDIAEKVRKKRSTKIYGVFNFTRGIVDWFIYNEKEGNPTYEK